jgi:hypothetical protein
LDLDTLHSDLAKATMMRDAIAAQVAQNATLQPSLEAAEATLSEVVDRLEKANTLRTLALSVTQPGADVAASVAAFNEQVEAYYRDSISGELESDASLMETLKQKFMNGDRRNA